MKQSWWSLLLGRGTTQKNIPFRKRNETKSLRHAQGFLKLGMPPDDATPGCPSNWKTQQGRLELETKTAGKPEKKTRLSGV